MKLDILAIGAHPDDVELYAGGTLVLHIQKGFKCGIVDLTRGELGTRGNADLRDQEAAKSSSILGLSVRDNLRMADGFFMNDKEHQLALVRSIRKYRPELVLATSIRDRHPDHGRAASLISNAVFLAGLPKIITRDDGREQEHWKVKAVYHGIQDRFIEPDFVIDVSSVWDKKMEAVMAYSSQFYNPDSKEPQTAISSKEFLEFLKARAREYGRPAGLELAEGFTVERTPAVSTLFELK